MGKSFSDDIFNNGFNLDSINGLNISKEAIEENKKKATKPKIDISKIDLSEAKKEMQEAKKEQETIQDKSNELNELKDLEKELNRVEKEKPSKEIKETTSENEYYTKKTMIFKSEYLDIIMGLASVKDMEIKNVLNQIIELGINKLKEIDNTLIDKAIKESKKNKSKKENNSLF